MGIVWLCAVGCSYTRKECNMDIDINSRKMRFSGDSGVDIAQQKIDVVFPDGERRSLVLKVGSPYRYNDDENSYRIRAEIVNLDRTDTPLPSANSVDALIGALSFIKGRLRVFEEKHGCRYYWPGTDEPFDYNSYFDL